MKIMICCAYGALTLAGAASATPCATIPLDTTGPRPTLMLTMNGRAPVKAIFDTGNMATTVDSNQASALGLVNSGPLKLNLPGHAMPGYQSQLKQGSIGSVRLGNLSVAAMPSMMPGIAAVVGPSAFGNRFVVVDYASSQLRICPRSAANRPSGPGEPYTAAPVILPAVAIVSGNTRLIAHIDTGSPLGLSFPMRYEKSLKLSEPLKKIGIARSHFGEQPIFRSKIDGRVKVGGVTLDSPIVHFSDVVPNPNVGGELLRKMTITIDPVAKLAWTAPIDAHLKP